MPASIPRPTGSATTVLRPLWQRLFPDGPSTTELGASPGSAHTSNVPKVGAGQDSNASGWNGGGPGWSEAPRTAQMDNETRFGAVAWYTSLLRTTLSMRRSGRWERRHGLLGENATEHPPRQSGANQQVEPAWLRGTSPDRGVRLLRGCPSRVAD